MPKYDLICPECGHYESNVICCSDEINNGELKCPKCGKPMKIDYSTFRPTVRAET